MSVLIFLDQADGHIRKSSLEAACYGAYENETPSYACNDCCGHGCEDGRCWPISPGYEVGMTEKDAERQIELQ